MKKLGVKRVLSFVMAACMVLALAPDWGLSVMAADNVTAPAREESLTYNGAAQALLSAEASSTDGTERSFQYAVNDSEETAPDASGGWQDTYTNITGTDAGTYYVWYRYATTEEAAAGTWTNGDAPVTVTIAQKPVTLTWTGDTFTYNGESRNGNVTATAGDLVETDGDITVQVTVNGEKITGSDAINAGTYTATAAGLLGDKKDNYKLPEDGTATHTFTITQAKVESLDQESFTLSVKNGTALETIIGQLDTTVGFTAEGSVTGTASIAWDQSGVTGYDPAKTETQSFQVTGTLTESSGNFDFTEHGSVTAQVTTTRDDSQTTVPAVEGEKEWGTELTVTATVEATVIAAAANKVEFSVNGQHIESADKELTAADGGTFTTNITISADNHFHVGENTIKAEYGGGVSLNGSTSSEITVTVVKTLAAGDLSVTVTGRDWDGTDTVTVTVTATGLDSDSLTLTATGKAPKSEAGSYTQVSLSGVTITGGDNSAYYRVASKFDNLTVDPYTINKVSSSVTGEGTTVTYGDPITLTATVSNSTAAGLLSTVSADADQVVFTLNGETIGTETVSYTDDNKTEGAATLTLTAGSEPYKKFAIGANTVTAEYGGSVNLNDSTSGSITVTLNKKQLTYTLTATETTRGYDGTTTVTVTAAPVGAVSGDELTVTVTAHLSSADVAEYTSVEVDTVTIGGDRAGYYEASPATGSHDLTNSVEITAVPASVTAEPTLATGLTYTGAAQDLVTGKGTATGGTIQFAIGEGGDYSSDSPTGTDANAYEVWYKVVPDKNHTEVAAAKLGEVTIGKADPTVTVTGPDSVTYGDEIALTAKITAAGVTLSRETGAVTFLLGEEELGTGELSFADGSLTATLTLTAGTENYKKFVIGQNSVTARLDATTNLNGGAGAAATVSVGQKTLTYSVSATDRAYAKGDQSVTVTLTPSGFVEGDTVTLTANGQLSSDEPGQYNTVNLSDITPGGADAERYTVAASSQNNVSLTEQVSITDDVAPVVTPGDINSDTWYKEAPRVTLTATDNHRVESLKYAITTTNAGPAPIGLTDIDGTDTGDGISGTVTVNQNGESVYIYYEATDASGKKTTGYVGPMKIDASAPTLTVTSPEEGSATLTLTASGTVSASGGTLKVTKDGADFDRERQVSGSYNETFSVTEAGTYVFTLTSGSGLAAGDVTVKVYQITFTDDEESASLPTAQLAAEGKTPAWAAATLAGHTFNGWKKDGTVYTSDSINTLKVNDTTTLTADWTLQAPTVSLTASGSGTAEYNNGETVITLTATPSHDSTDDEITYTYKWYKDDQPISALPSGASINDQTATLELKTVADSGAYKVEVTATCASHGLTATAQDTVTATVTPVEVDFEVTNNSVTYNGAPQTATVTATSGKDKLNDGFTVTYDGAEKKTDAGTYTVTVTLTDPNNFKFASESAGTASKTFGNFVINKSVVTFEESNGSTTYDTNPHQVTLTNKVTGGAPTLQPSDYTVHYAETGKSFDQGVMDETKAGAYDVWVQLTEKAFNNYEFTDKQRTYKVGTLTVGTANLDLTIKNVTITYGAALTNDLLDGSTAKIRGDNGATITGAWSWDEEPSTYPKVSDSEGTRYKVTFTPDGQYKGNFVETDLSTEITIKVNPYPLTPQVVASSVTGRDYNGDTDVTGGTLTFENMDLFNSAPFSGNRPTISGTFAYTSPNAGTNTVNVTGITFETNGANYSLSKTTIEDAEVTGSIRQKEVELTWALDGKTEMTTVYTAAEHTVTATAATGVGEETVKVTVTDGKQTNAGSYTATASELTNGEGGGLADNYKLPESTTKGYTISKAPVSFTVTENSVPYDTRAHKAAVTQADSESPRLSAEDFSVVYTAQGAASSSDGTADKTEAGTYDIWVKLNNENFKFDGEGDETREKKQDSQLTVNASALTLTIDDVTITYGTALTDGLLSGKATIADGTEISGAWSWDEEPSTYPAVSDSKTTYYTVKFTPSDKAAANFTAESLSKEIQITVNPYQLTPQVASVDSRIYDGTTGTTGGTLTFAEAAALAGAPFNTNTPTATGTFTFTDKNVGTEKHVNVAGITLSVNPENYRLSTDAITDAATGAAITAKEVTLTWQGHTDLVYSGSAKSVTATTTDFVDADVQAGRISLTYTDNDKTDAGTYTARASLAGDDAGNYTLAAVTQEQEYTIDPAPVSFTVGGEVKEDWTARGETNDDPNPDGYRVAEDSTPDVWTDVALTMTYDSYAHRANVAQTAGEDVAITAAAENGFTVTYRKGGSGNDLTEIRDAGTYEIWVTLNPTAQGVYNYVFSGQGEARTLKIGEITVEPYAVHVIWSHLNYVYHAHPMHPNVSILNAFNDDRDDSPTVPAGGPAAYRGTLLAYAVTEGSDVGEYQVTVGLYGTRAGNYTVDDDTETMNIVAAPVTFTVGDNIWDITDDLPDSVTLRAAWGEVTTTPDTAVHDNYPTAGTRIPLSELAVEIQYRQNERILDAAPSEAGEYEIWVKIGNTNYRHAATGDGDFHLVGELVLTDDPESVQTHTVVFDPNYEGGVGPAALEDIFANQTVILPAASGRNADGTTYDMTRPGSLFRGWSHDGITYQPNEEFHMPASDVTFTAQWLDIEDTYSVGGLVMQESAGGPQPVHGADVTLTQGAEDVAEYETDSDGRFSFEYLTPGLYNLVIRYNDGSAEIVKTFLVEITDDNVTGEYTLPAGALNTVVEVASGITAVADIEGLTAQVDGEIYTAADEATVAGGGTVEFRMSVENGTAPADAPEIPVSEDRIGMVLDLGLTKTVTERRGTSGQTEIHDTRTPIPTVIHLPAELQGKTSYTIYRFHEVTDPATGATETEMHTITTEANADGEYLEVISDGTAIALHARYYSTYVLTWYQDNGVDEGTHRVALPKGTANGEVTSDLDYALKGSRVTLTVKPGEGCDLQALSVTNRSGETVAVTDNGDGTYSFIMPAEDVTVNAEFGACPSLAYPDLNVKAWYHPYTDYVITRGLMHGKAPTSFVPDGIVTRAEMVTVLWNMSGTPVVNYLMTYTDVSEEAWYAEAIRWASSEGIVDGYGNNAFGPDDPITREQMATMLYRYEKELGGGGFTGAWMFQSAFTDAAKVNDWAREAVAWCGMNGILEGRGDGSFDPAGKAQRSELAKVLTKYRQISGQ